MKWNNLLLLTEVRNGQLGSLSPAFLCPSVLIWKLFHFSVVRVTNSKGEKIITDQLY